MYSYKQEDFVGVEAGLEAAVIVPIFNEAGNIKHLTERLTAVLGHVDFEIIFVDDGSTDGIRCTFGLSGGGEERHLVG